MKRIPLTRGKYALVDDEDYERLSKHKWRANKAKNGLWYAERQYRDHSDGTKYGKQIYVSMHREVMKASKGKYIDHIDHNGLNNQKSNLRFCTQTQNCWNQRSKKKYKGVYRADIKKGVKWTVNIQANGVSHYLGCFTCQKTAAKEYDKLAKILHGEFAQLNFPAEKDFA